MDPRPTPPDFAPEKAGIFLYGWDFDEHGHKRLYVLSPWTEGRFGSGTKFYGLSKGAIDPGETPLQTAVRETDEEGGINVRDLMGPEAYARFLAGEEIRDLESEAYPGVGIVRTSSQPVAEHSYISGHGAPRDAVYYGVEVSNILKLRPYLKHVEPGEISGEATVKLRASQIVKDRQLPNHTQMRQILRSGMVPAVRNRRWAQNYEQQLLPQPLLPALEKKWLEAHSLPQETITSTQQWLQFLEELPGPEYKKLSRDFDVVKRYLEKCGVIGDANGLPKLDTKDNPMNIYREDGDILPLERMISRSLHAADEASLYANSVWGDSQGKKRFHLSPQERFNESQIAPLVQFFANIAPMELAAAGMQSPGPSRKKYESAQLHPRAQRMMPTIEQAVSDSAWAEKVLARTQQLQAEDGCLANTKSRV